jgi:hypothetical protein
MRKFVATLALLFGALLLPHAAQAQVTCALPYNLQNGVIYDATQVMADLLALQACFGGTAPSAACSTSAPGLVPATGGVSGTFLAANCTFQPISVSSCSNLPAGGCPYDTSIFLGGVPANSAIVRKAIVRAVSCPTGFAGSVGYARESSSGTAVVTVNQVTAGVGTARGTVTFAISNTGVFASGAGMTLSSGDLIEFAFPSSADATMGDIAISLKCDRV